MVGSDLVIFWVSAVKNILWTGYGGLDGRDKIILKAVTEILFKDLAVYRMLGKLVVMM
jgi:hypothetical protein